MRTVVPAPASKSGANQHLTRSKSCLRDRDFAVTRATPDACRRRHVRSALLAEDGSGNQIDLVVRPSQSGQAVFSEPRCRHHPLSRRRVAIDQSRSRSRVLASSRRRGRDWVGDIAYLQIDGFHHRIALYPSKRNGLLYAAFEVETLDSIMQNSYFMQESQVKIVQGPGREPCSRADIPARRGSRRRDLLLRQRHDGAGPIAPARAAISAGAGIALRVGGAKARMSRS